MSKYEISEWIQIKSLFNREIKKSTYRSALGKMPIPFAGRECRVLYVMSS